MGADVRYQSSYLSENTVLPYIFRFPRPFKILKERLAVHYSFWRDNVQADKRSMATRFLSCLPTVRFKHQVCSESCWVRFKRDCTYALSGLYSLGWSGAHVVPPFSVSQRADKKANCFLNYLPRGSFLFVFDLQSAFHHVDVAEKDQTYIFGFAWSFDGKIHFFVFTVFPAELSSVPFVFTKLVHAKFCALLSKVVDFQCDLLCRQCNNRGCWRSWTPTFCDYTSFFAFRRLACHRAINVSGNPPKFYVDAGSRSIAFVL